MKTKLFLAVVAALLVGAPSIDAQAGPGDVYVAAHRTRDGSRVPANVPPSSGGTRPAGGPGTVGTGPRSSHGPRNGIVAPIFVRAKTVAR